MKKEKAIFCWSGGKDSAFCLHEVLQEGRYEIAYLLTTVNENFKRVSMHGVREELLEAQARAVGIPLVKMYVKEGSNEEYERNMERFLLDAKANQIHSVIFGDIFLEDLRAYREKNMEKVGMKAIFPLWKKDTGSLIRSFIDQKFRTITCCISDKYLDESFAGAELDAAFLSRLPAEVDPCGENGEFHTFCYAGPVFRHEVKFTVGEKIYRPIEIRTTEKCAGDQDQTNATRPTGFWFCDLIPESDSVQPRL